MLGIGRGGMNRQRTEVLRAVKKKQKNPQKTDTIMMGTCHYTFAQTHRMYNTKNEPHCKLWTLDDYDVSL